MGSTLRNDDRKTAKRRSNKKKEKIHRCRDCGFKSTRAFNVSRHHDRIHKPAKRQRECCGEKFSNKGAFYQHCVDVHPELQRSSKMSKYVYKITKSSCKKRPKIKVKLEEDYFDENTPLIYFLANTEAVKKEDIKLEEFEQPEICFKGDSRSPMHSSRLLEYLRDIDFESLKLRL